MAAIRGSDTKPELLIRRGLHRLGFRYRLHVRGLPGNPDLVFPKFRAVLFVHGCFWHGHDCPLFRLPQTREAFWKAKIGGNVDRDSRSEAALQADNWRIGIIWECALKGPGRIDAETAADAIGSWLRSDDPMLCLSSVKSGNRRSAVLLT